MPPMRTRQQQAMGSSPRESTTFGERRRWWDNTRLEGVNSERRHLAILSVLGGLVFFGAGCWGATTVSGRAITPQSANAAYSVEQSTPGSKVGVNLAATGVSSAEDGDLKVRLYNSYTENNPVQLYPWEHLAEPYKPTVMEVLDWPASGDDVEYRWDVDGHLQGYGRSIQAHFAETGTFDCSVIAYNPQKTGSDPSARGADKGTEESARIAGPYNFQVRVKYVRRELRSLTDQDREMFFNAVAVLQRVPSSVGQGMYGSKYYSKDYLTRLHLYYGGTKDCDHWHQGAGFVTSHMGLTLMFEQSLQSINPAVSVPYWDFTLESTFFGAADFRSSGVFADDWFGVASTNNELHTPTRGRFAYVSAMSDATEFSRVHNSYGLLRSPWNNDPTPFMTRHEMVYGYFNNLKPSGCFEYSHSLKKDTWMSMSKVLNAAAHGHIHETIGGSWNHYFGKEAGDGTDNVLTFAHEIQALSKELWRAGFLDCPMTCSHDTPWRECQCECDAGKIGNRSPAQVLAESGVLDAVSYYDSSGEMIKAFEDEDGNVYYTLPGYTEKESDEIFEQLLYLLCTPGHIGTMFQATSTNDVIFWVLHPTVDRLWHLKRLAATDFDETWDPFHTCVGHNPEDSQPFHDLFPAWDAMNATRSGSAPPVHGAGKNGKVEPLKVYYKNSELYELLRPDFEQMPYMYDDFSWPHCSVLGEDMIA